jgi:hypothetical protein
VRDDVRALVAEHVDALAGSIELQGIARSDRRDADGRWGRLRLPVRRRLASCRGREKLGLAEAPAVVREGDFSWRGTTATFFQLQHVDASLAIPVAA